MAVGSSLGDYEVDGTGTRTHVGLVYHARDRSGVRQVLIKALDGVADRSEAVATELSRIATLRHPNILPIEHLGEADGVPYVVTAAEPAVTLADRLADGRLDRAAAVALLAGIARAIDHAHGAGVRHGGLDPTVVKMAADGTPLVADFGLARLVASQAEDEAAAPADVHAFAAIAYQLLTGTAPFAEPPAGAPEPRSADAQPAPPSTREPALPALVDEVLLRGLAKDSGQRWPSCGALLAALEPAFGTAEPGPTVSEPARRGRAPSLVPLAVVAALVLVAGILLIALVLRLRSPEISPEIALPPPIPGLLSSGILTPPSAEARPKGSALSIRVSAQTVGRGGAFMVSGAGFDPRGQFLITLDQQGGQYQLRAPTPTPPSGSFSVQVFVPGQAAPGPASIRACSVSASGSVETCAEQPVSVAS